MRPTHSTLTRGHLYSLAREQLLTYLPFGDFKRSAPASTVVAVLLAAAARLTSIADACRRLRDAPSDQTIRTALHAQLDDPVRLQRQLNAALAGPLPRDVRRRPQSVALDLTLTPYHGRPWRDSKEIYRSKAKSGTSHFHAYATAYVVRHGERFTLALLPVAQGTPMKQVVQDLLRLVRAAGVAVRRVLLDREFYNAAVITYLKAARVPFLMPVAFRGRRSQRPAGPTSVRRFRSWKHSGWSEHRLTPQGARRVRVDICVVCRNYRGQWRRRGRKTLVYAAWGVGRPDPLWVFQTYRKRFGIESSYRQLRQAKARTTTRSPHLRLLLVGVALLLRNLWVWLHWAVLSRPRRGRREIHLERLRFKVLLLWLLHGVEEQFGVDDRTSTERNVSPSLGAMSQAMAFS